MKSEKAPLSSFVFNSVNTVFSLGALSLLAWILLFRNAAEVSKAVDLRFVPAMNAAINTSVAVLLLSGRWAIARGQKSLHQRLMITAVALSVVFLCGYLAYHFVHGDTKFGGEGLVRNIYLALLVSHIALSMAIVPMVLAALWHAYQGRFDRHQKITRWLWPIWLYVSVSGVVVYFFLRPYYPVI